MNVCVKIVSMFFVFSACSAMQDTAIEIGNFKAKLRADCPIKLSEDEKKQVLKNLEDFLTTLSKSNGIFSGPDGKLFDLRCIDLSGNDFLSNRLSFLDFRGSNLDNMVLQKAYIVATDFSQASMRNIRGPGAKFENCAYDLTDFSSSDFNSAQFLTNIDKDNINREIVKTQFLLKDQKQSARGAKFVNTNLSNSAALRNMDLSDAIFDGADFLLSEVDGVFFNDAVSFKNTQFKSTRFTDSVIFGSSNHWDIFLANRGAKNLVDTSFGPITTNFAASL